MGVYASPRQGNYFLGNDGKVIQAANDSVFDGCIRAIVHRVLQTYDAYGVTWTETGEFRPLGGNEAGLTWSGAIVFGSSLLAYKVLRPVGVLGV